LERGRSIIIFLGTPYMIHNDRVDVNVGSNSYTGLH